MKRFTIAAAVVAGLLWGAGPASAQYRANTRGYTMSGHTGTMSGHLQTNHSHLMPRPVGVTNYSPQYYGGGFNSPYGSTASPGGNYYNPSPWSGPVYPA